LRYYYGFGRKKIKKNEIFLSKSLRKLKKVLNLHSLKRTDGLWCNGNTTVFGAVFQGSSPCRPTDKPLNREAFFM
jgi:hypothetical protein